MNHLRSQDRSETEVSDPQKRRRRGLSLRSQLLNKALASSMNPFTESPNEGNATQLDDLSSNSQVNSWGISPGNTPPPVITVEQPQDSSSRHQETHDSDQKHHPFSISQFSISRSSTRLTSPSIAASSMEELNTPRARKLFKHRAARRKYLAVLYRLKQKILGESELGSTEAGRVIPLCLAKEKANQAFHDQFYSSQFKGYIDERSAEGYCSNSITSSRYTIYSFFPKQLRAQFSKLANCYFMVVAIMQLIPSWSTTGQYTTIVPLMIFMSISMAREAYDDWKRHGHDKEENSKKTRIIKEDVDLDQLDTHSITTIMTETIPVPNMEETSSSRASIFDLNGGDFSNMALMSRYNIKSHDAKWQEVQVGDILRIKEGEWVPADVILLAVENSELEAYVETMALDGETNLKTKAPHPELAKYASRVSSLKNLSCLFTVEDPNPDLYNFEGHFSLNGSNYALGPDNIVYRGSILRNTRSVLGLVVFTGEESKIRMNNIRNPRTKAPKLQTNINYIVMFMVVVVVSLSAFSLMAERIIYQDVKDTMWYTYQEDVGVAATLMGFIIMYNTLIPLSLYVTMEIIKVMQLLFLQMDIDMYHVETNTPADAKTATILEELGQVSYIFSDKTGTLTDNKMVFRKFSVCGTKWVHELDLINEEKKRLNLASTLLRVPSNSSNHVSQIGSRNSFTLGVGVDSESPTDENVLDSSDYEKANSLRLLKHLQSNPNTIFSKRATFFLMSLALCHTCQPRKEDQSPTRNASTYTLDDFEKDEEDNEDIDIDASLVYQAASPDESALVQAARDLGFVVIDKQHSTLSIKTYPEGFGSVPKFDKYEILDVIEFSSVRKRMSIVVRFPNSKIGVFCKGADNIILKLLKNSNMAEQKAKDIALSSNDRKIMEAEAVLQSRLSNDLESTRSSLRDSIDLAQRLGSIDGYISREEQGLSDIATKARDKLHRQQATRYSLDESSKIDETNEEGLFPNDRLVLNDEFVIEKTLEHVDEFSNEGLRTLLYSFKWLSEDEYEEWSRSYHEAKIAIDDRAGKVERVGAQIEANLQLLGATAIEDKLQEGVSETIEKLRRAGIKMWMLTGDKRETAINIGHSCHLIKDFSTVIVLSIDEGLESLIQRIKSASNEIKAGRVAHSVVVIDGATLGELEKDSTAFSVLIELCIQVDSAICCRASPSQKAEMVNSVRKLRSKDVTLAIGDGANDIAMIQSADIGVGITGKEGLQAARSADYSIAQFRFLLKLLLVNGRYNYIRTSKFVLCTFYKELLFYLTQCIYQRYTNFTGSSLYESWSLSMFNTLFTSLPVICIGMFEKDLRPSTLLAVPELYSTGRLYKAFNLKLFLRWMLLAASQSVAVSFLAYYSWGFTALRDNTTLPIGTALFWALVIVINGKIQFLETHFIQWLAFASFFISVLGYGLWNILIMLLHRGSPETIFYVDYGLLEFGADFSWWATVLMLPTVLLCLDLLLKVCKFIFAPNDTELFQLYEKDINLRRSFEQNALQELSQSWFFARDRSTTKNRLQSIFYRLLGKEFESKTADAVQDENLGSAIYRKRAGTRTLDTELPPGSDGVATIDGDFESTQTDGYEILPSGLVVKTRKTSILSNLSKRVRKKDSDSEVDKIIEERIKELQKNKD